VGNVEKSNLFPNCEMLGYHPLIGKRHVPSPESGDFGSETHVDVVKR
jgi:hypothetical protein